MGLISSLLIKQMLTSNNTFFSCRSVVRLGHSGKGSSGKMKHHLCVCFMFRWRAMIFYASSFSLNAQFALKGLLFSVPIRDAGLWFWVIHSLCSQSRPGVPGAPEPVTDTVGAPPPPKAHQCHLLCLCPHPPSWKLCFERFTPTTFFRAALRHWNPVCADSPRILKGTSSGPWGLLTDGHGSARQPVWSRVCIGTKSEVISCALGQCCPIELSVMMETLSPVLSEMGAESHHCRVLGMWPLQQTDRSFEILSE